MCYIWQRPLCSYRVTSGVEYAGADDEHDDGHVLDDIDATQLEEDHLPQLT